MAAVLAAALIVTGGVGWATDGFSRAPWILDALAPPCPPTVPLNGAGSTMLVPLMTTWVRAYEGGAASRNRGCTVVQVTYNASSALGGLGDLGARGTDFATTEEPPNPSMVAGLAGPIVTLPIALTGVAIAYHVAGIPAGLNLTGPVLAAIYMGTVTEWNDSAIQALNPGVSLPSGLPITVVHAGPGSSTSFVFTQYLSLVNSTWATQVGTGATVAWPVGTAAESDAEAASLAAATDGAIAYLGFPSAQAGNLTCADLENPAGRFVGPSPTSFYDAATAYGTTYPLGNESWQNVSLVDLPGNGSYPLTTFTYAIAYADLGVSYQGAMTQNTADWVAAFLFYMSIAGQSYGTRLGYTPLPSSAIIADKQIVELLRYDGVSALGDIDYDGD